MNATYIRMIFYVLAPMLSTLPGVTYDSVAQTVLIDLEIAAIGFATALTAVFAIFAKWGKK